jgi:hypothetical protein
MKETPTSADRSWAVFVSSYDGNSDLWPIFFHFFFKEWKDAPTPVYLVTNYKTYNDPRVVSLKVGDDTSWSSTIQKSLAQIPQQQIFLMLDDFFLRKPVSSSRVDQLLGMLAGLRGRYLEVGRKGQVGPRVEGTPFRRLVKEYAKAGINSAVLDKTFFQELTDPGLTLWQVNTRLTDLNRADAPGLYYFTEDEEPIVDFEECVRGRFWKPLAVKFLESHAILADYQRRPCPVQARNFFGKLVRSFHKRSMSRRQRRENELLRKGWKCVVSPMEDPTRPLGVEQWIPPD